MSRKEYRPNFLFIGPDKSGSTWVYQLLRSHPQVFMSRAKELFYFDLFYEKGMEWYLAHFAGASGNHAIIGEISHDYLFSVEAAKRIKRDLPSVQLMVCLREPVERAFSSYLYMVKQGRVAGSFEEALQQKRELIEHGRYHTHLAPYLELFGVDNVHVGIFDELRTRPQVFADKLADFLQVNRVSLPEMLKKPVLSAAKPRSRALAAAARQAGLVTRKVGYPEVVTWVKGLPLVQQLLYKPYGVGDKPKIAESTKLALKETFRPEVERIDALLGLNLSSDWNYR